MRRLMRVPAKQIVARCLKVLRVLFECRICDNKTVLTRNRNKMPEKEELVAKLPILIRYYYHRNRLAGNSNNGHKRRTLRTRVSTLNPLVPQNREGTLSTRLFSATRGTRRLWC